MANQGLPTPGEYLTAEVKDTFNSSLQQLMSDLGRTIWIHLQPYQQNCPNCLWDNRTQKSANRYRSINPNPIGPLNKPFQDGQRCPVCNGLGKLNTPRNQWYTALISKDPKQFSRDRDYQNMNHPPGKDLANIIKTLTLALSFDHIRDSKFATIDGFQYQLLMQPVRTGLGNSNDDLKYVKSFWQRKQ